MRTYHNMLQKNDYNFAEYINGTVWMYTYVV